jgi:glycosyltransferase involved in cell wall biosynthesis
MKLSIIVPTKGRSTLGRTLDSIIHQMAPEDEVLVVTDGPIRHVDDMVKHYDEMSPAGAIRLFGTDKVTADNGGSQRDLAIQYASGDVLLFMDDDDIYTRSAFATIRTAISDNWGVPHIFRMYAGGGGGAGTDVHNFLGALWRTEKLEYGNVGTPMIVVPRLASMPTWAAYHKNSHDFGFIHEIITRRYNGLVVWHPEIIAIIRPTPAEVDREIPRLEA